MKINKISEHEIYCLFSKEDLNARNMKLSELAYGSEKMTQLFNEIISQLIKKFGFKPNNSPLLIEAIPMPSDSLAVYISKTSYPDELDSRFAYFSDAEYGHEAQCGSLPSPISYSADEIIDLCSSKGISDNDLMRHYIFDDLDTIVRAAKLVNSSYKANNSLYKDKYGRYHLLIYIGNHTAYEFNKVCNFLSEFGTMDHPQSIFSAKIKEHAKLILSPNALNDLSYLP